MSDENNSEGEGKGPRDQVAHIDPAKVEVTASEITASHTFSPDNIRERLNEGEHVIALILTSTLLEKVLSLGIRDHYGWDMDKFKAKDFHKNSPGKYLEECTEYGVFKEYRDELDQMRSEGEIVNLRNKLVHDTLEHGHNFAEKLEEDEDLQEVVEEAIDEALEFIENVRI